MEWSSSSLVVYIGVVFVFLLSVVYSQLWRKHVRRHKLIPRLPPGSMGWPYIGETLHLYSRHPNSFFSDKHKRYGDVFKTHILGCPCVMLASPEASRFVLVSHAHLFKPTYPRSKERMVGPAALFFHQGDYHAHLRKLVQTSLSPDTIKKLIPSIESIALSILHSFATATPHHLPANTFRGMKMYAFEVGILSIFGELEKQIKEEIKEKYAIVDKGYNSFPTKIPGTAYHKALMARRRLGEIIRDIIADRKQKKLMAAENHENEKENDLLGHLLKQKGKPLTDDQIADNIVGVLFAAQDTTASSLTWILYYLHHHPHLLQAVKAEQSAIYLSNDKGNRGLTWTQTRNMPFTYRVIQESLRMASVVSFTFREAVVDVEYNGYLIQKGWKVMPLFRNIHHNPEFFNDPQKFDPHRFDVPPKPNTYMPFGNGAHSCPGNELAKLEMLILIHHLVNKYRWEVVGPMHMVQYKPFPVPYDGLPARFWKDPYNLN
ncbi:abscisic acid 8'-hydroxylase 4-like [Andrographis paniculata]|uniref:abscisic acid 8'-hydroxylase 4-like n=1 Tax=Andrographis paniculata TaxID=175694 RepID=UPI0021E8C313|nr:abscisic acid 8'-hydroxylase 4-like [Andrographis paniculata]